MDDGDLVVDQDESLEEPRSRGLECTLVFNRVDMDFSETGRTFSMKIQRYNLHFRLSPEDFGLL